MSRRQRLNTRSSTEAELVGVNDTMNLILWTRLFLQGQGYEVSDNIVYQDNQSAMLLEKNGKMSSSKRTRHLEIRYFFVTDNIGKKHLRIEYCPTDDMVADFFTKPLQGTKFRRFRAMILNLTDDFVDSARKECVETTVEATATAKCTTRDTTAKTGYVVPGRLDDEVESTASWVDVVRGRSKAVNGKQGSDKLSLFTNRKY